MKISIRLDMLPPFFYSKDWEQNVNTSQKMKYCKCL
jgi:hypothetical protein